MSPVQAGAGHYVVLVGDDGLGVGVLEELRGLGVAVSAVSAEAETPFARAARHADVPLVVGDPEDPETLIAADVAGARACGLVAADDLANLHAALLLQELAPGAGVVLRLYNTSLADAVRDLVGDSVVLSATELAAPAFVEAALRGSAGPVVRVRDRTFMVQEVDGSDPRLRLALADAEAEHQNPRLFPKDARRVVGIVEDDAHDAGGPVPALAVVGDATTEETINSLRLESARALMAMTTDDVANLQCALLARTRAKDLRVVLRLSDPT